MGQKRSSYESVVLHVKRRLLTLKRKPVIEQSIFKRNKTHHLQSLGLFRENMVVYSANLSYSKVFQKPIDLKVYGFLGLL